jgi:hypothetical protein
LGGGQVDDLICTGIVQKMMIVMVNICSIYVKDGNSAKKIEILSILLLQYWQSGFLYLLVVIFAAESAPFSGSTVEFAVICECYDRDLESLLRERQGQLHGN